MDSMDSLDNWVTALATATLDTTNFSSGNAAINVVQHATGDFSTLQKSSISYDFSDADFVEFNVWVNQTLDQLPALTVYLFTLPSSKYFQAAINATQLVQGYNRIRLYKKDFSVNGGAVWSDPILRVKFAVGAGNPNIGNMTFDNLQKGYRGVPKAIFVFDDGFQTLYYNAYPIMSAAGFRGNCALISSTVQGVNVNYMRKSTTDTLYSAGWDMCNHTTNHVYLTQQADNGLVELQGCKNWLNSCGYTRASDVVVYPYGDVNALVVAAAKSLGYNTGIIAGGGARALYTNAMPCQYSDKYNLLRVPLGYGVLTVAQIKGYIDQAILHGDTIIFMAHNIIPSGCSTSNDYLISDFQTIVNYVKASGIDVVTVSEWANGMTNPRKQVNRS